MSGEGLAERWGWGWGGRAAPVPWWHRGFPLLPRPSITREEAREARLEKAEVHFM